MTLSLLSFTRFPEKKNKEEKNEKQVRRMPKTFLANLEHLAQ